MFSKAGLAAESTMHTSVINLLSTILLVTGFFHFIPFSYKECNSLTVGNRNMFKSGWVLSTHTRASIMLRFRACGGNSLISRSIGYAEAFDDFVTAHPSVFIEKE